MLFQNYVAARQIILRLIPQNFSVWSDPIDTGIVQLSKKNPNNQT